MAYSTHSMSLSTSFLSLTYRTLDIEDEISTYDITISSPYFTSALRYCKGDFEFAIDETIYNIEYYIMASKYYFNYYMMMAKYYLFHYKEEDPVLSLLRTLVMILLISIIMVIVLTYFFRQWKKYMATKADGNDNNVATTQEIEEIYELPKFSIKQPTFDQLFQQYYYYHFEGVRRFCFDNNTMDNIDIGQINSIAFKRMIMSYEHYIKIQLKMYEDVFNNYDEQLDNRFRNVFQSKKDSIFFPVLCYLQDQHELNSNNRVDLLSNMQLPSPDQMQQVLYNNLNDIVQKYNVRRLGLKKRQSLYQQAFNKTMALYEMELMEQMQVQRMIWLNFEQRMNHKLKVLQKIQYATFYQKVQWSCQLEFQNCERYQMKA